MTSLNSEIEEWLKPILDNEGLATYSIGISGSSEKGDGYIGDITFLEVNGKTKTDQDRHFEFVLKSGKRSKDLRKLLPVRTAFENEINFYNEIYPEFLKFQKEKGIKVPFDNVPKCYGTLILEDIEILVLENMKKKGYALHDRSHPMDKEHIRTVIKTYGKLHAISFALRDQKPELFKKLAEYLDDFFKIATENMKPPEDSNMYQMIIDLAQEEGDTAVVDKAHFLNQRTKGHNDITDPSDPFAVLLHGDCWNNNFMFRYKNDTISDICLLDFQLSRLASPVYDLSYFLFTCLSEEDIENFDEINNLYYETFSAFLRELGSDPNVMFPYEELLKQWKKFSIFGLVMMPGIVKACVSEKDEVADLTKAAEDEGGFGSIVKQTIRNKEQYRKRTLPIIRLVIERQFVE